MINDVNKYTSRGFTITKIHADNEFDIALHKNELCATNMHLYAKEEHIGVIKNGIKTIKERARCMCLAMPYQRFTKMTTQSLVESAVEMLNMFPSKNSFSEDVSLATILEGKQKLDMSVKRLEFESYAMVYVKK